MQKYSKTFLNGYLIFICGIYTPVIYKDFNTTLTCLVLNFTPPPPLKKKKKISKKTCKELSSIFPIKKIMVHIYRKCLPLHILTKDW